MLTNNELKVIRQMNKKFMYMLDCNYMGNPYWTTKRRAEFEEFLERQNAGEVIAFQYCTDRLARTMCQFNADSKIVLTGERFVRDVSEILGRKVSMADINRNYNEIKNTVAKAFAKQLSKTNQNPTTFVENNIRASIEKFQKQNNSDNEDDISCFQEILY